MSEDIGYQSRNEYELFHWPEFSEPFNALQMVVMMPGEVEGQLKSELFLIASAASGCRHCQAHGGYALNRMLGLSVERIQALWTFEASDLFNDAERAAYRFALAAGSSPNAVTPAHHAALRAHYSVQQIREILAIIAMSGFLNRYSDSLAVVTDATAADWAAVNLAPVGWSLGKHAGAPSERREDLPF